MSHATPCMRASVAMLALFWASSSAQEALAITFTTIDNPLAGTDALQGTRLYGIEGGTIVGSYVGPSSGNLHGFRYEGSTFTPLNGPTGATEVPALGHFGRQYRWPVCR